MSFENKILRLVAHVNTKKKMKALFQYFKDNNITLSDQQIRTAMNKFTMLPDDDQNDTSA